jgi:hypothetical protein
MFNVTSPPKRHTMERHGIDMDSTSSEPDTKRRKLRKGTTSCWDCKKRKVKCTYDVTSDTVCIACRRRGAPCLSQDEDYQDNAQGGRDQLVDRMQRVESLLEQLIEVAHKFDRDVDTAIPIRKQSDYVTPGSDDQLQDTDTLSDQIDVQIATISAFSGQPKEHRKISEELLKAFPSQDDVNRLCKTNYIATFHCHQIFTNPSEFHLIFSESDEKRKEEAFEFVKNPRSFGATSAYRKAHDHTRLFPPIFPFTEFAWTSRASFSGHEQIGGHCSTTGHFKRKCRLLH